MSLASFLCELGPAKSGLFTPEEISCLTRILKNGSRAEIQNELSSPPNNPLGIPTTLRPYYRNLARPRCPIRTIGHPSPAKKSKRGGGLSLIERWNHRRCCRSRRNNRGSRSNSQLSSPSNSNPSSPRRNFSNADQSKKWNLCVERVVIFLACLFDWKEKKTYLCHSFVQVCGSFFINTTIHTLKFVLLVKHGSNFVWFSL